MFRTQKRIKREMKHNELKKKWNKYQKLTRLENTLTIIKKKSKKNKNII